MANISEEKPWVQSTNLPKFMVKSELGAGAIFLRLPFMEEILTFL